MVVSEGATSLMRFLCLYRVWTQNGALQQGKQANGHHHWATKQCNWKSRWM